jgi:hypothetical protein
VKPIVLGSWRLSSGNSCDLVYRGAKAARPVTCAWDHHPLTPAEQLEYLARVQPMVIQAIREYTETLGRGLVVTTLR